jgi:hypothetical protein
MEFIPPPPKEIIDIADDSDNEGVQGAKQALPGNPAPENVFSDFETDDEDDESETELKPLIAPSTDIKVSTLRVSSLPLANFLQRGISKLHCKMVLISTVYSRSPKDTQLALHLTPASISTDWEPSEYP